MVGVKRNGGGKKNHRDARNITVILANYAVDCICRRGLHRIICHVFISVNALWKHVENLWKNLWKNLWIIARRASIKYDDAKVYI